MERHPRITVAVPSHDMVPFLFTYDLAQLMAFTAAAMPEGVDLGLNAVSGTYIHVARNDLMESVLQQNATHVLWIDSDMRFPRESLVHLLRRDKAVVGINYAKRGIPTDYVAIKTPNVKCVTNDESEGLEEVTAIGFGMVLIRLDALRDMPDPNEVPWFQNIHLGGGDWMGEDVHFCELLRQSGQTIYVDHDLSKHCKHIGQFEYELGHVEVAGRD